MSINLVISAQNTNIKDHTIEDHTIEDEHKLSQLHFIIKMVENMSKFNQLGILRIFSNHKEIILNENKYGIHINLIEISQNVIDELICHINYVNAQELDLKQKEQQYKSHFFE